MKQTQFSDTKSCVVVRKNDSFKTVVSAMALESKSVKHAGLAVVLNEGDKLLGVVTDGDIRRAYARTVSFDSPISDIMTSNPVVLQANIPPAEILTAFYAEVSANKGQNAEVPKHVLCVDKCGKLISILDLFDLLRDAEHSARRIVVFGMGYVGLTLAVALANSGHYVTGVDLDSHLIDQLRSGNTYIHEPGLFEMLNSTLKRGQIKFEQKALPRQNEVYVVAVGTPLDANMQPDLTSLESVAQTMSEILKPGDMVVLRSTVPTGTTRDYFVPIIEKKTSMKAGIDFYVAFCPERTIEGRAMQELRTLPQIVGGYSDGCLTKAVNFWSSLTPTVVQVESLEAAELVKLANNTFRDVSFAFANELALMADKANVSASNLINAANEGYPRNSIPLPSPGVGGYCLTKDPYLYGASIDGALTDVVLGRAGRSINERAAQYPFVILERFAKRFSKKIADLSVLLVGLAFKGVPETTDVRGSTSLGIAKQLENTGAEVLLWDAVMTEEQIQGLGVGTSATLKLAVEKADCILILNNHPKNVDYTAYGYPVLPRLIFDGWSQLDRLEIESVPGQIYATMGYMTAENASD